MKKLLFLLTLICAFLFTGCAIIFDSMSSDDDSGSGSKVETGDLYNQNQTYGIGATAKFYVSCNTKDDKEAKSFTLKASGTYCNIWYIDNDYGYMSGKSVSQASLTSLASKFDALYKKETNVFGSSEFYVYGNKSGFIIKNPKKINIIVYDLYGDSTSTQRGGVYGFFYTGDMYTRSQFSKSNATEVFDIDSRFLTIDLGGVQSTLFHEFQHMLNFVNKIVVKDLPYSDQTWFNEMNSLVCEDILFSELGIKDSEGPFERLSLFNKYYSLGFKNWRKTADYVKSDDGSIIGDVFASYANAYAFGAYLLRNYGGVQLYSKMAENNYSEPVSCINAALSELGYSEQFDDVLSGFYKVLMNTDNVSYESKTLSLNKGFYETFNGIKYSISPLDLFAVPGHSSSKPVFGQYVNTLSLPVGAYSFAVNKVSGSFDINDFVKQNGISPISFRDSYGQYYLIRMNYGSVDVSKSSAGYLSGSYSSYNSVADDSFDRTIMIEEPVKKYTRIDYYEDPEEIIRMINRAKEGAANEE